MKKSILLGIHSALHLSKKIKKLNVDIGLVRILNNLHLINYL